MKTIAALLLSMALSTGFTNPVIPGFHPDPSVCAVGDDFYLVTSTFQYFPGVPVFHSRDLVHWEQIGNALDRPGQLPLSGAGSWSGIYAPTIRYHDGLFYMVTTNTLEGLGNFYVTAENPAGPWSDMVMLEGQPGIDPTLFWEGGKCYSLSNRGGIFLNEIDLTSGKALNERQLIWNGTGGRYIEAPHLYKKDGWYYLMVAEGGTEAGHGEVIGRSRNIYGPYEGCPGNPILSNYHKPTQNNLHGTGHADLVQASDGSWWMVFLAYRIQNREHHLLGRETCLAPVEWPAGGWPVVFDGNRIEEEMEARTLPQMWPDGTPIDGKVPSGIYSKGEDGKWHPSKESRWGSFGPEWLWLNNPVPENYEWTADGKLLLHGTDVSLDVEGVSPTFVAQRQESMDDEPGTELTIGKGAKEGSRAGISVYMASWAHCDISLEKCGWGRSKVVVQYSGLSMKHVLGSVRVRRGPVKLHVTSTKEGYSFGCTDSKGRFSDLGWLDCRALSTETVGGFVGTTFGLFAEKCDATFSYFAI